MHTRQGAAEPARPQNNPARDYSLAHVLRQGPNRSRITVGPYWLECLIRLFVSLTSSRRRMEKLDAISMGLVAVGAVASAAAVLVLAFLGGVRW